MNDTNPPHPPTEQLRELSLGRLSEQEAADIGPHVWDCPVCLQRLEELPDDADPFLSKLRAVPPGGPPLAAPDGLRVPAGVPALQAPGATPLPRAASDTSAGFPSHETAVELWPFLAPPEAADELGRLAQYRVLGALGQGAMGLVFQAEDEPLRRPVALKVLKPHLAEDPSARQRFLREARAMAAIRHDHVVAIHQVGEYRGVPFLAMELLHGESLDHWLEGGRRPSLAEVLRLGREIAGGLAAAHGCELIHRDVKPANVWLESRRDQRLARQPGPEGEARVAAPWRVKLLDFGLAYNRQENVQLTAPGVVVGTPAFMSPEQARNLPIDARSDLFSLGCVLYRLCTGRPPFEGATAMAVLTALAVDTPAPVRQVNPDVPPALADLVTRLLAKKPADRPPSAEAVVDALQAIPPNDAVAGWQGDAVTGATAVAAAGRGRKWRVVGAAMAISIALTVLALVAIRLGPPRPDPSVVETDDPALTFRLTDGGVVLHDRKAGRTTGLKVLDHDDASGEYLVEVADPDAGPEARPRAFTVRKGQRVAVRARFRMQPDLTRAPPPAVVPFSAEEARQYQHCWADYLRRPVAERNSSGMRLLLVPAGEFQMGSGLENWPRENPVHTVRLTRPFYLAACEVTVGQFRAFVDATGYRTVAEATGRGSSVYQKATYEYRLDPACHWRNPGFAQDDDHPVCCVSWDDAVKFCEWLGRKEGRAYRLPREAEWEFACRAGTVTPFYPGRPLTAEQARFRSDAPRPVGSYPPNAFGLFDLHGNVAEWCQDGCRAYSQEAQTDPDGGTRGLSGRPNLVERAVRGGNWINFPYLCRSAVRNSTPPSLATNEGGFRVLCVLEKPGP